MKFHSLLFILNMTLIVNGQDTIQPPSIELDTTPNQIFISGEWGIYPALEEPLLQEAQFPGGTRALMRYILDNLTLDSLTEEITNSRLYVEFIVDSSGTINNAQILRGINEEIDKLCIDLIMNMPNWIPAVNRNGAVHSKVRFPIIIDPEE